MHYELYIDSLFFTDFVMNYFLLILTGKILKRSVTRFRSIVGAAYGAIIYCIVFVFPIFSGALRVIIGAIVSFVGMVAFTFKCKDIRQIIKVIPSMAMIMLMLGGIFFVFKQKSLFVPTISEGLPGIVVIGVAAYVICNFIIAKTRKIPQTVCKVELITDKGNIKVNALIDTGNLLIEPISQKPVSVLDEDRLKTLFGGQLPEYYRVVPYTSVGRKRGLMKCFEIPRILIDIQDEEKICEKVLIACGEELTANNGYMILNPRLFNKEEYNNDF